VNGGATRNWIDFSRRLEYSDLTMKFRQSMLLVLVSVLAVSTPLALASPPDPTWIGGMYDDADFDDVVILLTTGAGAVEHFTLADACPIPAVTVFPRRPDESSVSSETPPSLHARAPPAP
jgi:hypothetical protein